MLDYAALAVPRLTGQFRDKPGVEGVVSAIVGPLSDLEATADALTSSRWIATAVGAQLDGCGAIVGEARLGRDDAAYRDAIRFRVSVNTGEGTPRDLIRAVKFLTAPTDAQYLEAYPATAIVFTNGLAIDATIQPALQSVTPAGVSTVPVMVSFASPVFRFGAVPALSDFFANDAFLTVNTADLQVTAAYAAPEGVTGLGGVIPAELDVGLGFLDVGGGTLAMYDPNAVVLIGTDNIAGVFQ